jgi:hypothetical protein
MHIPKLINSGFDIYSPRNKNARITANTGDVLFKKANLDKETSLTAKLKTKNVKVPKIALTITSFHAS